MKYLIFSTLAFVFGCCGNKQNINHQQKNSDKTIVLNNIDCPTDGTCSLEILKNTSLVLKTDPIGAFYYETQPSNNTDVIIYKYTKTVDKTLQDAGHEEDILVEIPSTLREISLENNELQQAKVLYGRHCFCKGQAGYFKVENGKLSISKNASNYILNVDAIVTKVPQKIKSFSATLN